HLPIGILLVALLLQFLAQKEKYSSLKVAIPIVLLWGSIAALVACITGYLLLITEDYDRSLVNWHMWMAIGVLLVSLILYTKEVNPKVQVSKKLLSIGLLILITVTGHLGGSLTHGSDYLTKPFFKIVSSDTVANVAIKPVANVQEALVYPDVIQPILQTKCYSCHNENKQKGKLRMDDISLLMKGGKHGSIIDVNSIDSSEMLQRLLLPVDNEKHMPPKEKPQPTEAQIALLHWWISNKADFKKKVKDLEQPEKIKPVLLALQKPIIIKKESIDIPTAAVEKADDKTIAQLREKGWLVLPVSQNSNYLSASLTNANTAAIKDIALIKELSKQLIFLQINHPAIDDDALLSVSKLSNLRRLNLTNTSITNKGLQQLKSLEHLQQLNLVGTKISAQGILQLQNLKRLKNLYLYQTGINNNDTGKLRAAFTKTDIDFGNYIVPLLVSDTTLVKPPAAK
ncbi:MAG: c-type cytochrome domain-containing protein, partial [Segetibacter sp.]